MGRNSGTYSYRSGGDISGRRNIEWYDKYVFSLNWPHAESLLDIGCGNGRLNTFFRKYFNKIYCIDPIKSLDDRFKYDGITFEKRYFEDFKTSEKFDIITFMGSFYLMEDKEKALKKVNGLLKPTGGIIMLEGLSHLEGGPNGKRGGYYGLKLLDSIRKKLGFSMKTMVLEDTVPKKKSKTMLTYLYRDK